MATVRPVISVYGVDGKKTGTVAAPAVFSAPIRHDVVHAVHTNMSKNRRQPYAVKYNAGMNHSAESWGVGRAMSRIPRVAGSGTSRSGQGAFGNMCRKGRMFAPTKTWRRWHRKTNQKQKRYATASAIAASALAALVMSRGHAIGRLNEIPLVIDGSVESIRKTKEALAILRAVGAGSDVARCRNTRRVTTGKSRLRGRTYTGRLGPLVVYNKDNGIRRAFCNIPGVEARNVHSLSLMDLAPGGHLGRFVIWTKDAVDALDTIFGTHTEVSKVKKNFRIPRSVMASGDLDRVINSTEIQTVLRARRHNRRAVVKHNPLTNFKARVALNPYALVVRRAAVAQQLRAAKARQAKLAAKKA